ncbi:MAG: DUF2059 domain-containing protein [Chthoniobacterales bacterium]
MKRRLFTFVLLTNICLLPLALPAAEDTTDTRWHEAERYLQAAPPKQMFADMAEKMAENMPPTERGKFKQTLTSQLNVAAVTKAMMVALVKYFTTDELKALADFYGSPVGKSAMQKFPSYMTELMPTLEREIRRAQERAAPAQRSTTPSAPTATPTGTPR